MKLFTTALLVLISTSLVACGGREYPSDWPDTKEHLDSLTDAEIVQYGKTHDKLKELKEELYKGQSVVIELQQQKIKELRGH